MAIFLLHQYLRELGQASRAARNGRRGVCDLARQDWAFGPGSTRRGVPGIGAGRTDDPVDPSADPVGAAVLPREAAVPYSLPVAKADNAAPEKDLLSKVGRSRLRAKGKPKDAPVTLSQYMALSYAFTSMPGGNVIFPGLQQYGS
jgi:hypothetical protein